MQNYKRKVSFTYLFIHSHNALRDSKWHERATNRMWGKRKRPTSHTETSCREKKAAWCLIPRWEKIWTYSKKTGQKRPAHLTKPVRETSWAVRESASQLNAEATSGGHSREEKGSQLNSHRDAAASFSFADEWAVFNCHLPKSSTCYDMDKVRLQLKLVAKKEFFNSPGMSAECDRFKLGKWMDCFQGLIKRWSCWYYQSLSAVTEQPFDASCEAQLQPSAGCRVELCTDLAAPTATPAHTWALLLMGFENLVSMPQLVLCTMDLAPSPSQEWAQICKVTRSF